jgi:hypothetical protein
MDGFDGGNDIMFGGAGDVRGAQAKEEMRETRCFKRYNN